MAQYFPLGEEGDMLSVEKWAQDKSPLIAILAPQMANTAQDIHLAFQDIKNRRLFTHQFPLPHLPSWFNLYRNHRKSSKFTKQLISDFSSFSPGSLSFAEGMQSIQQTNLQETLKEFSKLPRQEREELIREAQKMLKQIVTESFHDLYSDLAEDPIDPQQQDGFLQSLEAVEASFFYLVIIPCWILYQDYPTRLYRKARQGDFESLERLIRLDSLMIHDPSIGRQVHLLRMRRKRFKFDALLDAVHRRPKAKITRQKMKYAYAGLISAISSSVGTPLTEPQIRALFDAIAQDRHKTLIDTDLPNTPETFSKAIQRHRKPWQNLLART